MKITINQLRRIIKEEVGRIMEMEDGDQNKIESIEDFQTWLNNFRELDSNKKNDETLKLVSGAKWDDRKDYYDVRDGNLFLRSRLLAAIKNYTGELVKLRDLVHPGEIIEVPGPLNQGKIPEDFSIDKNPMDPEGSEYIGPGPKQPSTPVLGSRKYYMDKEGLPDKYRNAMTTEGENKSKVRR